MHCHHHGSYECHAQSVDQMQGVGGLVLDSLYSVNNKDQRTTKFVYEYNQARLPQIKWECSYIGQGGIHLNEPYIAGYDKYYYDEHDRQQKVEAYQESNGTFVATYIGVTTDIRQMQSVMSSAGRYYDMNGRQLNAKPTHEGIYLHNGKKLLVK